MLITSKDNQKIKYINKLKDKKFRDSEDKFLVETLNLIEEASKSGLLLEVYTTLDSLEVSCPVYQVSSFVMDKIKSINTSKVVGVCKRKESKDLGNKLLLLDGIQDPGNLGTIIRSSVAFGIDTIVLSNNSCDLYNDKVIRATEGAIFKINIVRDNLEDIIFKIKEKNIDIYGTDVSDGIDVASIKKDKFAIVMGNEGNGISEKVKKLLDKNIYIKTKQVESLNVAVATSIILYELSK